MKQNKLDFSTNLYIETTKHKLQNSAQCPLSIHVALALTLCGARGSTEREMRTLLSHGNTNIHRALGQLIEKQTFSIANAIFMSDKSTFNNTYIADLNENYKNVPAKTVNFSTTARTEINKWASDNTHGKIQEIIPSGGVNGNTKIVIANAVYFKEQWKNRFDKKHTKRENFHTVERYSIQVDMMRRTSSREQYGEHGWSIEGTDFYSEFKSLSLDYKNNEYRMTFVVPTEDNTLTSFQNMEKVLLENLSQQTWSDKLLVTSVKYLVQEQRNTLITRIAIPKFTIDTGSVDLAPIISDAGMIDAFSPPVADFTGISAEKPLFITNVFHRVYVQVDEAGTTAAAVTSVSGGRGGSRPKPNAKIFTLDRPFMFMLSHKETNTIIFIGKCMKP